MYEDSASFDPGVHIGGAGKYATKKYESNMKKKYAKNMKWEEGERSEFFQDPELL